MTDDGLPDEMAGTFYDFHQALTTTGNHSMTFTKP